MRSKRRPRNQLRVVIPLFTLITLATFSADVSAQNSPAEVDRAFARATQLHEAGDIDGAIRAYQAILASHPARVDVRSNLGAAYSRLGRYEEAIGEYKRALNLAGNNPTIRFNLAKAYYKAALFAEAATELQSFIAAAPRDQPERFNAILLLADTQVRMGEYKKVIELLSPLQGTGPENRTIAYLLGSALIGDGQMEQGQVLIDRVFRGEDSAEARLLIGSILQLADDGQNAIKELERAIELNPKLPSVHAWYGRALMRMGDADKAKVAFKTELAGNPNDFDSNLYMGILLKRDRQLDECLGYLSAAIRLRPRDSYARYHMGALYAALGKPGEARPLLEGVAKEHPDFVEARVLLASVYYRLNRKEDGDRERAVVQKLNAEQQAKQPGSREEASRIDPAKPLKDPNDDQNQRKERR